MCCSRELYPTGSSPWIPHWRWILRTVGSAGDGAAGVDRINNLYSLISITLIIFLLSYLKSTTSGRT